MDLRIVKPYEIIEPWRLRGFRKERELVDFRVAQRLQRAAVSADFSCISRSIVLEMCGACGYGVHTQYGRAVRRETHGSPRGIAGSTASSLRGFRFESKPWTSSRSRPWPLSFRGTSLFIAGEVPNFYREIRVTPAAMRARGGREPRKKRRRNERRAAFCWLPWVKGTQVIETPFVRFVSFSPERDEPRNKRTANVYCILYIVAIILSRCFVNSASAKRSARESSWSRAPRARTCQNRLSIALSLIADYHVNFRSIIKTLADPHCWIGRALPRFLLER